jgi:hypothetical protein
MGCVKHVGIRLNGDGPMSYSKYSIPPMAHPWPLCDPEHTVVARSGPKQRGPWGVGLTDHHQWKGNKSCVEESLLRF